MINYNVVVTFEKLISEKKKSLSEISNELQLPINFPFLIAERKLKIDDDLAVELAHYFGTDISFWISIS